MGQGTFCETRAVLTWPACAPEVAFDRCPRLGRGHFGEELMTWHTSHLEAHTTRSCTRATSPEHTATSRHEVLYGMLTSLQRSETSIDVRVTGTQHCNMSRRLTPLVMRQVGLEHASVMRRAPKEPAGHIPAGLRNPFELPKNCCCHDAGACWSRTCWPLMSLA